MFLLAQQDLDNAETNMAQEEAKAKINEAFQFLEESINLLQFEQEGTFEHSLCIGTAVGLLRRGYPIPKAIFTQLGDLRNTLWS